MQGTRKNGDYILLFAFFESLWHQLRILCFPNLFSGGFSVDPIEKALSLFKERYS